jgi:competence protein ComEA
VIYIDITKFLKNKNVSISKLIIIIVIFVVILSIAIIGYILQEKDSMLNIENVNDDNLYGFEEDKTDENSNNIADGESLQNSINNESVSNIEEQENIKIHIAGEVNFNGIIALKEGSRIDDAIEKAGGLTENADISEVNLAYPVEDGQKIYIPSKAEMVEAKKEEKTIETVIESGSLSIGSSTKNGKVNINTANLEELQKISGIGESLAQRIINYRTENGKFKNVEDLKNVSGIGDKKYESIKDQICI